MFMCCVKQTWVINLIYPAHQFFSYSGAQQFFWNPAPYTSTEETLQTSTANAKVKYWKEIQWHSDTTPNITMADTNNLQIIHNNHSNNDGAAGNITSFNFKLWTKQDSWIIRLKREGHHFSNGFHPESGWNGKNHPLVRHSYIQQLCKCSERYSQEMAFFHGQFGNRSATQVVRFQRPIQGGIHNTSNDKLIIVGLLVMRLLTDKHYNNFANALRGTHRKWLFSM